VKKTAREQRGRKEKEKRRKGDCREKKVLRWHSN
jgi:hypothetical protein